MYNCRQRILLTHTHEWVFHHYPRKGCGTPRPRKGGPFDAHSLISGSFTVTLGREVAYRALGRGVLSTRTHEWVLHRNPRKGGGIPLPYPRNCRSLISVDRPSLAALTGGRIRTLGRGESHSQIVLPSTKNTHCCGHCSCCCSHRRQTCPMTPNVDHRVSTATSLGPRLPTGETPTMTQTESDSPLFSPECGG